MTPSIYLFEIMPQQILTIQQLYARPEETQLFGM